MKKIIINAIIIYSAFSCASQGKQNISGKVIGFEKFNNKTIILIDFLNYDKIPNVLKTYYYNNLREQDFYTPQSIMSKSDSTRTVVMKSKKAKKGYLFINKYTNDFLTNNGNVTYIIEKDTINSIEGVLRLINLEQVEIEKIDTIAQSSLNIIKVHLTEYLK